MSVICASMESGERPDERRHAICPNCTDVHGTATCLVMGRGMRTIHYRCPECEHEWQHAAALPDNHTIFKRSLTDL